ncbi:PAS domain S-box-containing protein/diguanylate cyclase (GGDEF) domain-containing protein [Marinospirillum celere]|uniref:PAS domain S-box-containing protein/diguanylate cyclase (GGDEF) domain-containing protein n=1 Tax=Marinospirillum celere TaxID=1122252 RepID=A0A1I1J6I4_9GAMM|nr:diguanylate cyclase [Marinospirillum celere]SFC44187.1 PAS domain S-box-containing protein/diguanylate cyclase (GGDEF) domain-containing protein [Marinospirillum celere]
MSEINRKKQALVLIIEDEPGDAELIKLQLLERDLQAFKVELAASLGEARILLQDQGLRPDVILLDLNLPDSSGPDTVKHCRKLVGDVPLVVLTGLDDLDATETAIEAGAEDYLSKGEDASSLRKAIRYALLRHERDSSERLALTVFNYAREGIMITSAKGEILEVNDSFSRITGYSREEVVGRNPSLLNSGHHSKEFYEKFWQQLVSKGHWEGEIWNRRKNGEIFVENMTVSAVRDPSEEITQFVALFTDITEQKEQQTQLEHLAHFDALTGLPNRVLFNYRLHQSTAYADRHGTQIAIAYLDLDGFKLVNDTHGHAAGDLVLQRIADRAQACLRDEDTLARLGGDEFALVLESVKVPEKLGGLLDRLLGVVSEPVEWEGHTLEVTASIGITFYPQSPAIDVTQLLNQADEAMYLAKEQGKNCYAFHPSVSYSEE